MAAHFADIAGYDVVGIARRDGMFVDQVLDVTDFPALENYFKALKPDVVINCVGALVAHTANDVASAILLNSYLPHRLSSLGRKLGYQLIHFSTDCVFSGKTGHYIENAFRDADTNYGRSKALGEVVNHQDLTLRTSIIGAELKTNGTGLFDWFMKQRSGVVQGYASHIWSGVTTLELAKVVEQAIQQGLVGLYHLTNGKPIDKCALLKLFKKYTYKDIEIESVTGRITDKSFLDTRHELACDIPDYEIMVRDMVGFIRVHPELYPHYRLG